MQRRFGRSMRQVAILAAAMLVLGACASVVRGKPSVGTAPNANLSVTGDSQSQFDTTVKNALSDVLAFWTAEYPSISGGKSLPKIKGGFFSVDAAEVVQNGRVTGPAAAEGCVAKDPKFIIDNAAYCTLDDSIIWDRNTNHLVGVLANKFGPLLVALAFAHEFGHALQYRLGTFNQNVPEIDTESQADCAAGAFLANIVAGGAAHFRATPGQIDQALNGYLQVRDKTPETPADVSHGNGFDRLSAIDDGLLHGPTFCYSRSYFDRKFTERPFVRDTDYQSGGNETLAQVLDPSPLKPDGSGTGGGLQPDLNRFWKAAAASIGKGWQDVKIAQADHPKCGASASSEFGYCPADNTVYYSKSIAEKAYQYGDYALGTLFVYGWGLAVRHQLFGRSTTEQTCKIILEFCLALQVAVFVRNQQRIAQRHTARDGHHLLDRVRVRQHLRYDRVACFVIGNDALLLDADDAAAALGAGDNFLNRFLELLLADSFQVAARRQYGRLVDQVFQIGAREAYGLRSDRMQIDVRAQGLAFCMNSQDCLAPV